MKIFISVLLSVLVAFGITLGTGCALGGTGIENGEGDEPSEYEVDFSMSPRFPVVGQEAELTFVVSVDGIPEEGLMTMVTLAPAEEEDHHAGGMNGMAGMEGMDTEAVEHQEGDEHPDAEHTETVEHQDGDEHPDAEHTEAVEHQEGDEHPEAEHTEAVGHDEHDEDEEGEAVGLMAMEMSPGVYVVKYTFGNDGEYLGTVQMGHWHSEFEVAVRPSPVAWPFIIGLVGGSALLAIVVAVIKTARRQW